jgi:mutator family transposase
MTWSPRWASTRASPSPRSRICAGLDEVVTAFRTRRLDHTAFPYVYLDATYLHVRNPASQVVSMAVVVATGITAEGGREVLGLDVGDSEDEVFWRGFLTALKRRGLTGVRLVISDLHSGDRGQPSSRRNIASIFHRLQLTLFHAGRMDSATRPRRVHRFRSSDGPPSRGASPKQRNTTSLRSR